MLYDINNEKWSDYLLKIFNIPKNILPKVVSNSYNFGETKIFGSSIKIGGMAGDQQAASIGQACFKKGQSKSTYGTGCFLLMNIGKKFKLSNNKLLTTVAYKINNQKMFCYEGSIFVAGSAIQWLRDKLKFFKNSKATNNLYLQANKKDELIIIPALTGLGAPHWQPNVRGAILGLTRSTGINEIVKATLDSISYQTYDLIESMQKDSHIKIKEIKIDGGMVENEKFCQSLSNVLQINIIKPKNIETTALGAAYLAGLNAGLIEDINSINKFWKNSKVYKPNLKKEIINRKIRKWKFAINLLIKYYS